MDTKLKPANKQNPLTKTRANKPAKTPPAKNNAKRTFAKKNPAENTFRVFRGTRSRLDRGTRDEHSLTNKRCHLSFRIQRPRGPQSYPCANTVVAMPTVPGVFFCSPVLSSVSKQKQPRNSIHRLGFVSTLTCIGFGFMRYQIVELGFWISSDLQVTRWHAVQ